MKKDKPKSPNADIDKAIEKLMKRLDQEGSNAIPTDDAVRVINSAIAWEKVKARIVEDEPFNPDDL